MSKPQKSIFNYSSKFSSSGLIELKYFLKIIKLILLFSFERAGMTMIGSVKGSVTSFVPFEPTIFYPPLTLDQELLFAFEELDFKKASSLIEAGGNPNILVHLTDPMIKRYLEVRQPLFEGAVSLDTEMDVKQFIDQFLSEDALHPMVFIAAILKEEDVAKLLLDKGASTSIELADTDRSKINILQVACALNCFDLARFAILNNKISISKPEVEGDLSPFAIAIISGDYDMVHLLLDLKSNEVDPALFKDEYVQQFFEFSPNANRIRSLLKSYGFSDKIAS